MTRAAELIGQGRRRIAIVGTGISGLLAARLLCSQHDVTVYEADSRIGGHTHTVDVEVGGETRAWEVGRAFAFDDTIEHEAWNRSSKIRAILMLDVWNPHLSKIEQEAIARYFQAAEAAGLQTA